MDFSRKKSKSQKVYFSRKKSKSQKVYFSHKKSKSQKVYFSRKKSKSLLFVQKVKKFTFRAKSQKVKKFTFRAKSQKVKKITFRAKSQKVTFRAKSQKVQKFTFRAKSQKVTFRAKSSKGQKLLFAQKVKKSKSLLFAQQVKKFIFRAKSQKVTFCRKKAKHTFSEKNSGSEKLRLAKKGYKLKSTKLPYRAKGQKVLEKNTIKEQKNVLPIAENIKISFFQETSLKSRNVVIGPAESHNSVVKKQIIKLFCLPCFGQKSKNHFSPRTVEKPRFKKKMTKSQTVTLREVDSIDCFSRNKGHKGTVAAKYQKTTWRKLKHA